jgi:hypothetical protein
MTTPEESLEDHDPAAIVEERQEGSSQEEDDEEAPLWREEATKWVSTVVGLITAVVGTSTLLHEKFVLPFVDPISIKLELDFDSKSNKPSKESGSMVILKARAKNESERRKWLLKPHWILYGHTSQPVQDSQDNSSESSGAPQGFMIPATAFRRINTALEFNQSSSSSVELADSSYTPLETDRQGTTKLFLGMGQLFPVDEMHRGQEVNVQKVIRVPAVPNLQYIEAIINIPTLNDSHILESREEIRWGGCLVSPNWPWECLAKEEDAPEIKSNRGSYRLVNWRNFFCEDLPLSRNYSLSLHQLINTFNTRRYFKPLEPLSEREVTTEQPVTKVEEDRFCGKKTLGFHNDERTAVGAKTQTFNHSFLVSGSNQ